jgi:radical SAM protein with 4Fe4S-binding SPASM domain
VPAQVSIPLAPFPRRINVEPTNHCNQRCRLCPRQDFTRPLGFMSMGLFERIAAECAGHDTSLWLHFLGEPLLHRELVPMIRFAKRAGVRRVGLSTNGVSLRGAVADALLDSGLDRLECSMDADDREGYRAARGRDHFQRVAANVRGFLARKRDRRLDGLVTSIQFMRTPEVEARLAALVDAWRPYLGPRDFVMTIDPTPFGDAIDVEPPAPAGRRPPCAWLFSSLMILQDGSVTMCGADWDARAPLGHVGEATIAEIWRGAEAERRRRAHRAGRFADAGPCGACRDWRLADGGGYRNALAEIDARRAVACGGSA